MGGLLRFLLNHWFPTSLGHLECGVGAGVPADVLSCLRLEGGAFRWSFQGQPCTHSYAVVWDSLLQMDDFFIIVVAHPWSSG